MIQALAFIANNWRTIGVVLLMAISFWAGRDGAQRECEAADAARRLAASQAYQQATNDINGVAKEVRAAIDQAREQVRVVQVQVTKETQRVEYRCPVPDSGIELYNRAARGLRPE